MGALEVNVASSVHLITMWIIYMASLVGMVSGSCYLTGNRPKSSPIDAENYRDACADALMNQVHREFNASFTYLQMAAQFSQDDYYLPGVANKFLDQRGTKTNCGPLSLRPLKMLWHWKSP